MVSFTINHLIPKMFFTWQRAITGNSKISLTPLRHLIVTLWQTLSPVIDVSQISLFFLNDRIVEILRLSHDNGSIEMVCFLANTWNRKITEIMGKQRGQVFILDIYYPMSYKDPNHLQQMGKANL